ncbi:hypothetical protein CBR_g20322 [Chara braunii]|uniref:Uncharacterized protein n=1 Tax=Chara braunii TaxID=69332 RepID=A0A388L062_CHABU|nr:hypothetical protein CBR_g20322 [Chara braunii]|eukprot:GBG75697.1 hypothetical protein CBR_g20322 [Chara braunii]
MEPRRSLYGAPTELVPSPDGACTEPRRSLYGAPTEFVRSRDSDSFCLYSCLHVLFLEWAAPTSPSLSSLLCFVIQLLLLLPCLLLPIVHPLLVICQQLFSRCFSFYLSFPAPLFPSPPPAAAAAAAVSSAEGWLSVARELRSAVWRQLS